VLTVLKAEEYLDPQNRYARCWLGNFVV